MRLIIVGSDPSLSRVITAAKYSMKRPFGMEYLCGVPVSSVGWDSSVGTVTHYGLDGPGIESQWGQDFLHPSRLALGPIQPPVQWVTGIERSGHGADHPPPSKCRGHERVELYLYSPSGPQWSVIVRTFNFTFASFLITSSATDCQVMMFAVPISCPHVDVCGIRVSSLSEYLSVLYFRLPLSIWSVEPYVYTLLQGLVTFIPHQISSPVISSSVSSHFGQSLGM